MKPYYEEQGIRIFHADCRDILWMFTGIDLIFTDPPYGVDYQSNHRLEKRDRIRGDDDLSWLPQVWRDLHGSQPTDALAISFYGWPHADRFLTAFKGAGYKPISHLVWVKNVFGFGRFTRAQHEPAYLLSKGTPKLPVVAPSDVFEWTRDAQAEHPTEKPVEAIVAAMVVYSKAGDQILDPFMGGCTMLEAAKRLGLRAIGIEIEEKYCEIAANRLRQSVMQFGERRRNEQ